jgi:hypothetical protein
MNKTAGNTPWVTKDQDMIVEYQDNTGDHILKKYRRSLRKITLLNQ